RNLDYFFACQQNSVGIFDADKSGGELTIRIPKEVQACAMERRQFRISIEYSVDHPEGGIQFVTPKGEGTMAERSAHLFTYGYGNSSSLRVLAMLMIMIPLLCRLWFPCVDSFSEVCTWSIDITTSKDMIAVSCGELMEQILNADDKTKTFQYELNIPTSAPNIALAVGKAKVTESLLKITLDIAYLFLNTMDTSLRIQPLFGSRATGVSRKEASALPFEIYVDPIMPEVTNFCLPGLLSHLKHTSAFIHDVFEFYEEHLSCRYPYSQYKQVFVDEAYDDRMTYASMSIFNTSLLHSPRIIDQTFTTRRVLAQALAEQFFGCYVCMQDWIGKALAEQFFGCYVCMQDWIGKALAEQFFGCYVCMQDWSDAWLCSGISGYLYSLFVKKVFGNNEYRHWIMKENESVCKYEMEGPGLPPLHRPLGTATLTASGSSSLSSPPEPSPASSFSAIHLHPHLIGVKQRAVAWSKAHLVLRMIENRIGQEPLLQARQIYSGKTRFLKSISTVSGKDINVFIDQWICHSGIAKFHGSFVFNRKRNIVELDIKQDLSRGTTKYVGPLTVCIQELDGSFNHTVQIEDITSRHELPCHSKSRRNKKKKIPLMTGEEVDMNLDAMDSDSPVLWIRIDPEVTWLRHVTFEQPDYMWQYQLRHERDVMAQAKVASSSADSWAGHAAMMNIFKNFFSSKSCPEIIRYNDYSNFISYYILKTLPVAIASIRNVHSQCPREILQFLLDLLKYNDNRINKYSDSYYIAALMDALAKTVTAGVCMTATTSTGKQVVKLKEETQLVLSEVTRRLNLEKLLPSYRYTVTVSCLKTLRALQVNGQVPSDSKTFEYYSSYGHFEDVRKCAIDCLVDLAKVDRSERVLGILITFIEKDPVPFIRHYTLRSLAVNPPFTRKADSPLCTENVVERLWHVMNTVHDARLRCDSCDLYNALFGRLTPTCVPPQGMGIVIDLKKEKIMSLSPLAMPSSPAGSVSGEESTASKTSKRSHKRKRKASRPHSPSDLSHVDSQPGTPMSVESPCSEGNKLKLKIKLGNEEGGVDSNNELNPKETDSEPRKHKKKKKKHRHKDEKGKRKMSTSSSNYDSPLMFDPNVPTM
ncbi:hypothetical protein QZH41_020807, partial [Actinostola sp. cb2023]